MAECCLLPADGHKKTPMPSGPGAVSVGIWVDHGARWASRVRGRRKPRAVAPARRWPFPSLSVPDIVITPFADLRLYRHVARCQAQSRVSVHAGAPTNRGFRHPPRISTRSPHPQMRTFRLSPASEDAGLLACRPRGTAALGCGCWMSRRVVSRTCSRNSLAHACAPACPPHGFGRRERYNAQARRPSFSANSLTFAAGWGI